MGFHRGVGTVGFLLAIVLVVGVLALGSAKGVARDRMVVLGIPLAVMLAVFLIAVLALVRVWRT